jgi:hypothetical protein
MGLTKFQQACQDQINTEAQKYIRITFLRDEPKSWSTFSSSDSLAEEYEYMDNDCDEDSGDHVEEPQEILTDSDLPSLTDSDVHATREMRTEQPAMDSAFAHELAHKMAADVNLPPLLTPSMNPMSMTSITPSRLFASAAPAFRPVSEIGQSDNDPDKEMRHRMSTRLGLDYTSAAATPSLSEINLKEVDTDVEMSGAQREQAEAAEEDDAVNGLERLTLGERNRESEGRGRSRRH